MKTFQEVREYLSNIPSIHFGGCGVSALAMGLWLENNGADMSNFKLVLLHSDYNIHKYQKNVSFIQGKSNTAESCTHVIINWEGVDMDCSNEGKEVKFINSPFELRINFENYKKFLSNALNYGFWNPSFNREAWIPRIEKKLGINIQEIISQK